MLFGVVHAGPAAGDAAVAGGPGGRGDGGEGLGACGLGAGVLEPPACAVVGVDARSGHAGDACQLRAVIEHVLVAVRDQRLGRQHWGSLQVGAAVEHVGVTTVGQRRGGQRGGGGQGAAVVEHAGVTIHVQRRGGQQQAARVGERAVVLEKVSESLLRHRGGRLVAGLVHQAHDVAIHLHRGRASGDCDQIIPSADRSIIGRDAGAVAVELHLVAGADVDGGGGGDGGLVAAIERVFHAWPRAIHDIIAHHDGAVGEGLHGHGGGQGDRLLGGGGIRQRHARDAAAEAVGGYEDDGSALVDAGGVALEGHRLAVGSHRPARGDLHQLVLLGVLHLQLYLIVRRAVERPHGAVDAGRQLDGVGVLDLQLDAIGGHRVEGPHGAVGVGNEVDVGGGGGASGGSLDAHHLEAAAVGGGERGSCMDALSQGHDGGDGPIVGVHGAHGQADGVLRNSYG